MPLSSQEFRRRRRLRILAFGLWILSLSCLAFAIEAFSPDNNLSPSPSASNCGWAWQFNSNGLTLFEPQQFDGVGHTPTSGIDRLRQHLIESGWVLRHFGSPPTETSAVVHYWRIKPSCAGLVGVFSGLLGFFYWWPSKKLVDRGDYPD